MAPETEEIIPFEVEHPELGAGLRWLYALHTEMLRLGAGFHSLARARFEEACRQINHAGIEPFLKAPRNAPCPCGSGEKAKKCECYDHYRLYASF